MSSDDPAVGPPADLVAAVLTEPATGRGRLPALLELLDVGDHQVRLGAVTACCAVADEYPDLVPVLVRRLAARLDESETPEVRLAIASLAARFPDDVDPALTDLDWAEEAADGGHEPTGDSSADTDDDESGTSSGDGDAGPLGTTGVGGTFDGTGDWVRLVEDASRFDRLSVLAPRDPQRYGDVFRTIGTVGRESVPVALRLLDGPAEPATAEKFRAALGRRLDDWLAVSSIDGVLSLYDWGADPLVWATTTYAGETLRDSESVPFDEALWQAAELGATVAALHERGVVHAGIDPGNVVYYGNLLEAGERQSPVLDNVGLLHAYRYVANPASYLDPRFAAPEFFDRGRGRIDHATDIYHLGAVCYRLVTGEPPYAGDFSTVRRRVLSASPPRPSDVVEAPAALDDRVAKAMGKRKLARYETAAQVTRELRGLLASEGADAA